MTRNFFYLVPPNYTHKNVRSANEHGVATVA